MNSAPDCIFCKIVNGEIPADILFRSGEVLAFRDIAAQAPTHAIIIPIEHHENSAELAGQSPTLLAALFEAAAQIAQRENLDGYRTVFNTGASAGQSVFHVHMHLLGGRPFAWPPG